LSDAAQGWSVFQDLVGNLFNGHFMIKKILAALGLSIASTSVVGSSYSPYSNDASNSIYNLLFCDDFAAFMPKDGKPLTPWQSALFSEPISVSSLESLANDDSSEGRVRYLAFSKLRGLGKTVPKKQLLGVIVEVPVSDGLDTLAAYSEGGVRYINYTGKLAVVEGVGEFKPLVGNLFDASMKAVNQIGPWNKTRLPPPKIGNVRLTFLVSDGLYFGEGPMNIMQTDPMAGLIIQRATTLLQAVVKTAAQ